MNRCSLRSGGFAALAMVASLSAASGAVAMRKQKQQKQPKRPRRITSAATNTLRAARSLVMREEHTFPGVYVIEPVHEEVHVPSDLHLEQVNRRAQQAHDELNRITAQTSELEHLAKEASGKAAQAGQRLEEARRVASTATQARAAAEQRVQIAKREPTSPNLIIAISQFFITFWNLDSKGTSQSDAAARHDLLAKQEEERRALGHVEQAKQALDTAVADAQDAVRRVETSRSARDARQLAFNTAREAVLAVERQIETARIQAAIGPALRNQHESDLSSAHARRLYEQRKKQLGSSFFIEPKPGAVPQDAVAIAPERGLFAISDGVTKSDFPGELARALVRRWTLRPPTDSSAFRDWLMQVQVDWDTATGPVIASLRQKWFNRTKQFGGHATLLGAQLVGDKGHQKVNLSGIGDSVAFLVRGGKLVRTFPLTKAAQFSDVVEALPAKGAALFEMRQAAWSVAAGDEIFLATDALAAWALGQVERGHDPFTALRQIGDSRAMAQFVAQARNGGVGGGDALKIDDTSFVRFVVPKN